MELQPDRSPHARSGAFHRPDPRGMGTESEVSELLAGHVRALKPRLIVETGTFHADTTEPMLRALIDNARCGLGGELRTYEVDPDAITAAKERLSGVEAHPDAVLTIVPTRLQEDVIALAGRRVDVAFVDSAYAARAADVETLAPLMAPAGLLFVHDSSMKPMLEQITEWRRSWNVIEFATPRGLALLQRK